MPERALMASNPTIVIADDDFDDRLLIKEALREYSPLFNIVEVPDGKSLVEHFSEKMTVRPNAVILDINMPRMDGIDALATLKAKGELSDVPVFVLTTMRDKQRVWESLRYGVRSIYAKPNSHSELQRIIRQMCDVTLGDWGAS